MHDRDVHHGAQRTAYIRSVHRVAERASTFVRARDMVRAHLATARAAQVLLRGGAFERVYALYKLELNCRAIVFRTAPHASPTRCTSFPFSTTTSGAAAGEQVRVATKVEVPERVAVAAGDANEAQWRTGVAERGGLPERSNADELQRVAGEQADLVLEGLRESEYRAGKLCELDGGIGESGEVRAGKQWESERPFCLRVTDGGTHTSLDVFDRPKQLPRQPP